ncbi:hypothetical protein [Kibdelosporangium philippinense]|uniref:hypothetical protein n=1 Tax=Kibdelosporangium philippinense TaxID=211113 RepID=UPI0036086960
MRGNSLAAVSGDCSSWTITRCSVWFHAVTSGRLVPKIPGVIEVRDRMSCAWDDMAGWALVIRQAVAGRRPRCTAGAQSLSRPRSG